MQGVAVLLKRHGWSRQVPARRAIERDENLVAGWVKEFWPQVEGPWRRSTPGSSSRTEEVTYATASMLVIRDATGLVTATQPDERLSCTWDPAAGRMHIVGTDETAVATATARLAREVVRGQLLTDGWQILHASAVTRPTDGATLLTLGNKGAGKTTTGFLLARTGLHLLANDRVLARFDGEVIRVLPWPSAAAIGFGLPRRPRLVRTRTRPRAGRREGASHAEAKGDRRPPRRRPHPTVEEGGSRDEATILP